MLKLKSVRRTNFKGTAWYEIVAMVYLLYRYPDDCAAIPYGMMQSDNKLTTKAQRVKRFSETSLNWDEKKQSFRIPKGLWKSVKNCLARGTNFIVLPMGFLCAKGTGHANFLIYDSQTKEMERFEPNGVMSDPCYNPPNLEDKLKSLFNENVKKDMVKKVYEPLSFCPRINFQKIQFREGEKKLTDPAISPF